MEQKVFHHERASQQSEALLTLAMLLQDEDGVNYVHPRAITRQITILRLTEKRLRSCYDAVPRLLNQLSHLVEQLFVTSSQYTALVQQHDSERVTRIGDKDIIQQEIDQKMQELSDEWIHQQQKEIALRQGFIQLLKTQCIALREEIRAIQPIADTCIVQDILTRLDDNPHQTGSAEMFRKVIKRLTRKYQSVRTILSNPLLAAFEAASDNYRKIEILGLMNQNGASAFEQVSGSHTAFTRWAFQKGIPSEEAKNFWRDAATTIWEKLHWGDFDQQYDDSLTRLIASVAHNKVRQYYRERYRLKNAQTEQALSLLADAANQYDEDGQDEDEEDEFLAFETRRIEEYKFCASKLGFDFIANDDHQKSILYFGSVVKSRYLVWDDERREVESEMQIQLDSITQEAISELLNLGITQTAIAHRLKGYRRWWYSYTRAVLQQLRSQAYTTEKTGLIDFFQQILFWTMTKSNEAPTGTESWYADYARIRRQTLQSK